MRGSIPTVGRDTELSQIRQILGTVVAGSARGLLIDGPVGTGKSHLLKEAVRQAEHLGMTVASGRATELDRVAPLSLLLTALRTSEPPVIDAAELAELGTRGGQETNRFWLLDRIGQVIEEHGRHRPLLVALDNIHLMDELTALALQTLVPRLRSLPVMWVMAGRTDADPRNCRFVDGWRGEELTQRIRLRPLDSEAIKAYCAHVFGAAAGPGLAALAMRSGGNPFLLKRLLATLHASGRVSTAGGTAMVGGDDGLPSDFVSAVNAQLRHLSPATRRFLEAGAVLGCPFSVDEVAALLGRRTIDLMSQMDEAVMADVLVDDGATFTFRHDLVREAIYERLSGPLRRALHQEAAAVLEQRGGPRAEVALHLARGAGEDSPRTITALCDAAQEMAHTAPSAAGDLLLQALELVPDDDSRRSALVARTVRLLANAGRISEARELGESALHENRPEVYAGLAEALKHAGQDSLVIDYTQQAMAMPGVPGPVRAQLLAIQAHALLNRDDPHNAEAMAAEAMKTAEPPTVVFAAAARSAAARALGRIGEAVEIASDAVRLADDSGQEARHRHPRLWLGLALTAADRLDEADDVFERGSREAHELGSAWSLPLWYFGKAEARMMGGRLDDAETEALAGRAESERLGALAVVPSLLLVLAQVTIQRGDLARAGELVREARRLERSGYGFPPETLAWVRAQMAYLEGDPRGAVTALAGVYDTLPERPLLLTRVGWAAPALVRFALDADADLEAKRAAEAARRLADLSPGIDSLTASALHAEALLHGDHETLRAAVDAYRSGPRQLARAMALVEFARGEARAGRRSRAIAVLEEALELLTRCGAKRAMARAQRDLRILGIRPRKWRTVARAKTGWDSLTLAELRVVRLVAQGLTNRAAAERLFLSRHTVDTHLRHAFAKLGISSRVELARHALLADQESAARLSPDHVKA
ncbi:ATP-binding protein [Streptomyces litchfieldiae]|uniref:AAA family ATPase n=1 Tax=Streptomyces litchfieldiae TaxID=3075543 RepID=A0ABU2MR89_9ACTN|nr:AAA family ATPase [Streptomyces sp. DSM 44938]MDT0344050.1 AAA family ATPase [Streptomyces sp. DSM 44938]